jgi:hypothetical protein
MCRADNNTDTPGIWWYVDEQQPCDSHYRLRYRFGIRYISNACTGHNNHNLYLTQYVLYDKYVYGEPASCGNNRHIKYVPGRNNNIEQCYPRRHMEQQYPCCSYGRRRYRHSNGCILISPRHLNNNLYIKYRLYQDSGSVGKPDTIGYNRYDDGMRRPDNNTG